MRGVPDVLMALPLGNAPGCSPDPGESSRPRLIIRGFSKGNFQGICGVSTVQYPYIEFQYQTNIQKRDSEGPKTPHSPTHLRQNV